MSTNRISKNKQWLAIAALAGTAAVAAGAVHPAWAASTASPTSGRFSLVAHHGSQADVDNGTAGFGAGDVSLLVSPLTRAGAPAGSLVGECTNARVAARSVDQLCDFTLRLKGGQVVAEGAVHAGSSGPGTFSLAIVGGTGKYVGASGTVAVTATSGSTVPITVNLTR